MWALPGPPGASLWPGAPPGEEGGSAGGGGGGGGGEGPRARAPSPPAGGMGEPGAGGGGSGAELGSAATYLGEPAAALLGTPPEGLSEAEAAARLERFGRNELPEKRRSPLLKLLLTFVQPMALMIWVAVILEGATGAWPAFGMLLFLQLLNSFVGWWEDYKAGNAVQALKAALKPEAQVTRGGRSFNIDAGELVPGDIVTLSAGAAVPADCRVLEGEKPVQVDQAALTGESLPVTAMPGDEAKMGSNITSGESLAVVIATGGETFFGRTAAMIDSVDEMGHFQKVILWMTFCLMCVSIVITAVVLAYLLIQGESALSAVSFAVVLLVAAIPIAMQVVTTTCMALGSRTLAAQKAIVSRLTAIEELASMDMLCSDKTGTLTMNKMVLQEDLPVYQENCTREEVLEMACLAAKWKEPPKDALDTLVLSSIPLGPLDRYEQVDFEPFDPVRKYTAATLKGPNGKTFHVKKGAPQILLAEATNVERSLVETKIAELASRGIRALAVSRTNPKGQWELLGVLTFLDPPRHDTAETIAKAMEYGVGVKMITGDQRLIAIETCRTLGLGTNVLTSENLPGADEVDSKQLGADYGEMVEHADGFAEVFPDHKYIIVEVLRQRGFMVGMTGDGVNDAPALKRGDVGVAVSGATDAAKAAADIVLTEPGLSTIVTAIVLSREIFQRMRNYVVYRVAMTTQLLFFFLIACLALQPSDYEPPPGDAAWPAFFRIPVTSLVIITILNDGCMVSIAYDRCRASLQPQAWRFGSLVLSSLTLCIPVIVESLVLLYLCLKSNEADSAFRKFGLPPLTYGQVVGALYMQISLSGFLTVYSARVRGFFFTYLPGWQLAVAGALSMLATTLLGCYTALPEQAGVGWHMAGAIWVYVLVWWLLQDTCKVLMYLAVDGVVDRVSRQKLKASEVKSKAVRRQELTKELGEKGLTAHDIAVRTTSLTRVSLAQPAAGGAPPASLERPSLSTRVRELEAELAELKRAAGLRSKARRP